MRDKDENIKIIEDYCYHNKCCDKCPVYGNGMCGEPRELSNEELTALSEIVIKSKNTWKEVVNVIENMKLSGVIDDNQANILRYKLNWRF